MINFDKESLSVILTKEYHVDSHITLLRTLRQCKELLEDLELFYSDFHYIDSIRESIFELKKFAKERIFDTRKPQNLSPSKHRTLYSSCIREPTKKTETETKTSAPLFLT